MKKMVLILLMLLMTISIFGCSNQTSHTSYNGLITNLEKVGFNVIAEDVEKDILQGQRKWLTINENENISVYLYESSEKMKEDASYVDKGGSSYSNGKNDAKISWVSLPHFFKKDNIIVLYVGENPEIINALEELLGAQFAGDEKILNDSTDNLQLSTITKEQLNTIEEISLVDVKYDFDSSVIKFTLQNETNDNIYFGEDVILEKKQKNEWYLVPYSGEIGFTDILNYLSPSEESERSLPINVWIPVTDGEYRIIKEVSLQEGLENLYSISAEFTIAK